MYCLYTLSIELKKMLHVPHDSFHASEAAHYFRLLYTSLPVYIYADFFYFIEINNLYKRFYDFFPSKHRELQHTKALEYFNIFGNDYPTFVSLGAGAAEEENLLAYSHQNIDVVLIDVLNLDQSINVWSGREGLPEWEGHLAEYISSSCVLMRVREVPFIVWAMVSRCKGRVALFEPTNGLSTRAFKEAQAQLYKVNNPNNPNNLNLYSYPHSIITRSHIRFWNNTFICKNAYGHHKPHILNQYIYHFLYSHLNL